MEFLVEIEIRIPGDLSPDRRAELFDAEFVRGRELAEAGVILAIWRIPGRLANCGIWSETDATALHAAISSLPLWPFMDVAVTTLARHPLASTCSGVPARLDVP